MTKEEIALVKYPVKEKFNKKGTGRYDSNYPRRMAYMSGYLDAEQQLRLTPEDVIVLVNLYQYGKENGWTVEEVLKRFNETRYETSGGNRNPEKA